MQNFLTFIFQTLKAPLYIALHNSHPHKYTICFQLVLFIQTESSHSPRISPIIQLKSQKIN